ncbi:zinc ribbon domain-containing protein [Lachnoanaerobaculum umeaense]|uniref:Zinc ribbon domain-containing protein n=1 Tax=Lachnoanaerobaculum umeaense TaxID=617123 RepID=A0A385Q2L5_9FIRM|nr:zinc ribbon domain-containing protein [Lachnoanaerobaculum umeaense]AYA99979.1 zinc ribbon domain-containing protein [Lachnoanaerobaculum umeaense]PZW94052.1 hypothetical protein C7439_12322 [Lachnoanaerobaculum umeaense]
MAKFCAKCGAHMEDSDLVCGQCGTPSGDAGPSNNSKNKGSLFAILGGAIAAIIILVVIINIVVASAGYKSTLNKMVKAIKNNDSMQLEEISSSINYEIYGSFDYEEMLDNFLEYRLDDYEDRVDGEVRNISYEIRDKSEITGRKTEKYKDKLSDEYSIDTDSIKKMVKVKLKLTVKGSKKSISDTIEDLYLIQENGRWKIFFDYIGVFN